MVFLAIRKGTCLEKIRAGKRLVCGHPHGHRHPAWVSWHRENLKLKASESQKSDKILTQKCHHQCWADECMTTLTQICVFLLSTEGWHCCHGMESTLVNDLDMQKGRSYSIDSLASLQFQRLVLPSKTSTFVPGHAGIPWYRSSSMHGSDSRPFQKISQLRIQNIVLHYLRER